MTQHMTRRRFTQAAMTAALAAPAFLRAKDSPNRLRIAMIGSSGRGRENLKGVKSEDIVALCDVNEAGIDEAAQTYPKAARFTDFRKLFEKPSAFDAVVVSTCEHSHALATMMALKENKHVYCEKPLTHHIWEARKIREAAATTKVATQMGIQIHAQENYRRVVEIIQAGVIGPVREAHVWVSRAWGWQSPDEAESAKDIVRVLDRPTESATVPKGLHWDLWLGAAPARPFHGVYVPGPKWYRWWDFGNGTMSDLGSHWNDLPFWALKLRAPLTVEADGPPVHPELAPASMSATYHYGARGDLPPVKLVWHQGKRKPALWNAKKIPQWGDGVLFVGDKGMLLSGYFKHVLLPEQEFKGVRLPDPTLPRVASHYGDWIDACKTGRPASANFEYSGWLTEANHLGNVAYRVGKKLEWDADALRCTNAPEADPLIRREPRKGWELV